MPAESTPTTKKKRRSLKPRLVHDDASRTTGRGKDSEVTTCRATCHPQGGSSEALVSPRDGTVPVTVVHGSTQTEDKHHDQQLPTHRSHPDAELPKLVAGATQTDPEVDDEEADMVPTVQVCLLQTVRVPPRQSVFVKTTVETELSTTPLVFEPSDRTDQDRDVYGEDCLLEPSDDGTIKVPLTNPTAASRIIQAGEVLGQVVSALVVHAVETEIVVGRVLTGRMDQQRTSVQEELRKEKLKEVIGELDLPQEEKEAFQSFLVKHHRAFCLEDGERGETELIRMEIDTGDAHPRKQRVGRLPFALRQVVAQQLRDMQEQGVVQPSKSPWASPVVLVKKRDGTHRFCVDYRGLNAVTKPDSFPLPRIEDLLDVFDQANYFSSIDLASGFWQIRMHPKSQEKTAFVTPHGLYEFRVMPFGLMNAPAIF